MRGLALSVLGLIGASPLPTYADALDAANAGRLHGCPSAAGLPALHTSPALQTAARQLASGRALHDALESAGYLAGQSSAMHLSGATNDAQISHALTTHYCSTLTNPRLTDIGVERRGSEVWMVLAAPVSLPTSTDAGAVPRLILDLVNDARAAGRRCGSKYFPPVGPLSANAALTVAALSHSREMAKFGEFDHRGHDGSTPETRVQRAGYGKYRIVGENIAAGAMTAPEVTKGWLASPPHCENIMDGRFTEIGIAFAANLRTAEGLYWTQDFAAPQAVSKRPRRIT